MVAFAKQAFDSQMAFHKELTTLRTELDNEREARRKLDMALRQKDQAMSVLFERMLAAGIDYSDLIS